MPNTSQVWRSVCFIALATTVSVCSGVETAPPDLAGFWKSKCDEPFGFQIMHLPDGWYAVSFCGPGGCFDPGTYRPNTKILGDPNYEVINRLALKMRSKNQWDVYFKCTPDLRPSLRYPDTHGLAGMITDFGIFSRGDETIYEDPNSTSGQTRRSSGDLIERTILIPARMGIKFGFCYSIRGFHKDGHVALVEKTSHPEIARPDGRVSKGSTFRHELVVKQGTVASCAGYSFDHDFELKPGSWVFSIWDRERELIRQEFVVE
jgi:Domain of unknown function (DUF3859)